MAQGKDSSPGPGGKTRKGLVRDVLINWLRFDTSIFHDSFPATEGNVRRVIHELERFPGCYVKGTDSFNVDKVAEWVRINAAPFAERMEPPPFIDTPAPDDGEGVAPPGEPPTDEEVEQIHIESSVWDKLDVVQAAEAMDGGEDSPVIVEEAPVAEGVQAGEYAEGFLESGEEDRDAVISSVEAEIGEALFVEEAEAAEGHRQEEGAEYVHVREAEEAPEEAAESVGVLEGEEVEAGAGLATAGLDRIVLDEVNSSLDAAIDHPAEAVEALGSAYRGLREGLAQLVTEVKALTGREIGRVKDPGLQMEAARSAIRETVESLRKRLAERLVPEEGADLDGVIDMIPEEAAEMARSQGVPEDDPMTFLKAALETLRTASGENLRLKEEVQKLRAALERQFEVTGQIRAAWKKIMEEKARK